jgi:hypothetical protein
MRTLNILKLLLAALIAIVLLRVGLAILRGLARPAPEPPPPGEMRKVDFRYRCSICGAEARLTLAADEDPDPPRHCQEDMQLVTPVDD